MKPLTIELVKGQRQEFTFLGWKHDGLAFYAADPDGKPAVITPVSAYPDDSSSGEPYRFPRIVLLEIIPKQFEIGWSDYHRKVLKRWREAELAEVDAMAPASLFLFDAMRNPPPSRTPVEINQQRQMRRDRVEHDFTGLMETPLMEMLDPIVFPTLLDDFLSGQWADEMGDDFRRMINEAGRFDTRWHRARDRSAQSCDHQGMLRAMRNVRYVMRGGDKKDYPLTGVDVGFPTDLEAQAYAQMQQCQWGDNLPKQIDDAANRAVATFAAAGDHLATKVQGAAETLRQAQKDLQPTLDELETNQARLEDVVGEYKLKENPRQTRSALGRHGVSKRITDFILDHLKLGKPVPKAPTAARELQSKYATKDGLDRKTVDRHYQKALPILRAAGWPEHLLPTSNAADPSGGSKTGKKPQGDKPAEPTVTSANGVEPDSNESLTAFERIQQQEQGSADQP